MTLAVLADFWGTRPGPSGGSHRRGAVACHDMIAATRNVAFVGVALVWFAGCAWDGPWQGREADTEVAITATLRETAAASEKAYDHAAATAHYRRLFERDPQDVAALVGLARNLRISGQAREAIRTLKDTMAKQGEKGELLLELGKAQLAASLIGDARETLAAAQEKLRENWQTHAVLGIVLDRLDDHDAAAAEYRKALKLSPNNIPVLNNLALSLVQAGKLDEGISVLEKLAHGERSTMQVRQNLALLYGLKGEFALAERLIREDLPADVAAENMNQLRQFHR